MNICPELPAVEQLIFESVPVSRCFRRTKTGTPESLLLGNEGFFKKSLSQINLELTVCPSLSGSKISRKQVQLRGFCCGEQTQLFLGLTSPRKGNPACDVFSRCGNKLGGAWAFSLEEGRTWPGRFWVLLLEVRRALTSLTWVSVFSLQAVHMGMRALIYNSSTRGSQAEQSGMRTYYFSADTQEDMNAWVRAMNQAAQVLSRSSLKRSVPMEGPCQSASYTGGGTQIRTLGCPEFRRSLTLIKHCPLFEVLLNGDFFQEETVYRASTCCRQSWKVP